MLLLLKLSKNSSSLASLNDDDEDPEQMDLDNDDEETDEETDEEADKETDEETDEETSTRIILYSLIFAQNRKRLMDITVPSTGPQKLGLLLAEYKSHEETPRGARFTFKHAPGLAFFANENRRPTTIFMCVFVCVCICSLRRD